MILQGLTTEGSYLVGKIGEVCKQLCIKQDFTNADSPKQNGVVERALGIIQNVGLPACIQAPVIFPRVQPPTKFLRAGAVYNACDPLNHTASTANPRYTSPHEMWYGTAQPDSPHSFLRPAYCRWKRATKSHPRVGSCSYLGPGIDHPSDSLRVLTQGKEGSENEGLDVGGDA